MRDLLLPLSLRRRAGRLPLPVGCSTKVRAGTHAWAAPPRPDDGPAAGDRGQADAYGQVMDRAQCRPARLPEVRKDAVNALRAEEALPSPDSPARRERAEGTERLAAALAKADLYWVSEEMAELCRDATADLRKAHLQPDLWPSSAGFMLFAAPVRIDGSRWENANDPDLEPIRALGWNRLDGGEVEVTLFVDVTALMAATLLRLEGWVDQAKLDTTVAKLASAGVRSVSPAGGDVYPVGQPLRREDYTGLPAGFMLSTVWLLMSQRGLAQVTQGVPAPRTKAAKRRQAKAQAELDTLRIIELRAGTEHSAAYAGTTRACRHRWMVRGHWRQQWYPSLEINRPVWIAPHLKGPVGAPLLTGTKVHTWHGR